MGQAGGQIACITQIGQRVRQVTPTWIRRHASSIRHAARAGHQSAPQMKLQDAEIAPELLVQLRDDELLMLIGLRRSEALGTFYDRYSGLVFSIALRMTGAPLTAELVTQDVFQFVWHHAFTIHGERGPVSEWMVSIAARRALDQLRARSRLSRILTPGTPTGDSVSHAQHDQGPSFGEDVHQALAALPVDQRRALELACYGGLTTSEISAVLGTPEGTVRVSLQRGLRSLYAALRACSKRGEGTGNGA